MNDPLEKSNLTQAEYFKDIVATIQEPLLVLDASLRVLAANRSFYKFFKVKQKDTLGNQIYDLGNRQWDIPALRALLETILPQKAVFNDYQVEHDFPVIGRRILHLNARRISRPPKNPQWILLAFEDVTERRRLELKLQDSEERFHRAFETAQDGMLLVEKTGGQIVNSNQSAGDMLGYSKKALLKKTLWELGILQDEDQFRQIALELEAQGMVGLPDKTIPIKRGGHFTADVNLLDRAAVIQCNIRDIGAHKHVEEVLGYERTLLSALMDNIPDHIYFKDNDSRFIRINRAQADVFALGDPVQAIGKTDFDFFTEQHARPAYENEQEIIKTGRPLVNLEETETYRDGRVAIVSTTKIPFRDPNGQIIGTIGISRDITERKRVEDALHESEEKYRVLVEQSLMGIGLSRGNQVIFANAALLQIFGYDNLEEFARIPLLDHVAPASRDGIAARLKQAVRGESHRTDFEYDILTKDGKSKTLYASTANITLEGEIYTQTAFQDISERKQTEEVLREQAALLDLAHDAILVRNMDNEIVFWNQGAEQTYGWTKAEASGKVTHILLQTTFPVSRQAMDKALVGEGIWEGELLHTKRDGSQIVILSRQVLQRDHLGLPSGILEINRDITERKQAEDALRESEERYRLVQENSMDAILLTAPDGSILSANQAACEMFQMTEEEICRSGRNGLVDIKDPHLPIMLQERVRIGKTRGEITMLRKDGSKFPVEISSSVFFDKGGNQKTSMIIRDITERKQAEEALVYERTLLSALMDNIPDYIYFKDIDSRFIRINRAHAETLGISDPMQAIGKTDFDFFTEQHSRPAFENEQEIMKTGRPLVNLEETETYQDGRVGTVSTTKIPFRDLNGQIIGTVGISRDISERKQAEDGLRESEARFRAVVENSHDGILFGDANAVIHYRSPSYYHINGFTDEERIGHSGFETAHPDDLEDIRRWWKELIAQPEVPHSAEYRIRHKDGTWRWIESSGQNLLGNPDVHSIVITSRDITGRKQAEEALQEKMLQLENAHDLARLGSYEIDLQSQTIFLSSEMARLYGAGDEAVRLPLDQYRKRFYHPEDLEKGSWVATAAYSTGESLFLESRVIRTDGQMIWVQTRSRPKDSLILGMVQDITERKKMEQALQEYNLHLEQLVEKRTRELREAQEQLVREEKLATLGQLAGGVGHELRNPLGVISNSVYYLKLVQPDANEKIKKHHAMIEQEVHNAARIVSDLLDYARNITTDPQPGTVHELVEHTLSRFPVPAYIHVSLKIPAGLPQVYADPLHVEQIIGNLVTNACQAMVEPSSLTNAGSTSLQAGGTLTIRASVWKDMVAIAVKDTGTGIPPGNMPKLFEPLFSTKVTGIGLGLAVSKKLAEANGGRIEVKSEVGKGSTFTLYLPVKESL